MNIGIPVARFHRGNTAEYAQRAFVTLGHSAAILNLQEFKTAIRGRDFDYYFCVDSSDALDLRELPAGRSLERVGFWFIDYRHNRNRPTRVPTDFENARLLCERGGWVFQSQAEDLEDCRRSGIHRASWLPLAADAEVWTPEPPVVKDCHIGFVGNVWDVQRKRALEMLLRTEGLKVGFSGQGKVWKEEAAALMRRCLVGFNINTFFGQPYAYDVNMRAFETLSCGVPLFTNSVPSLWKVFPENAPFIRTYTSLADMMPKLLNALKDPAFLNSGPEARRWILENATYEHRMREALKGCA